MRSAGTVAATTAREVLTLIGRLLAQLHARDRAQLVIVAHETGLVSPAR